MGTRIRRAHAVLGTDRETGFKTCFAPHMQAGSSIMDGRTVRRRGAPHLSLSLSLFLFFPFLAEGLVIIRRRRIRSLVRSNRRLDDSPFSLVRNLTGEREKEKRERRRRGEERTRVTRITGPLANFTGVALSEPQARAKLHAPREILRPFSCPFAKLNARLLIRK